MSESRSLVLRNLIFCTFYTTKLIKSEWDDRADKTAVPYRMVTGSNPAIDGFTFRASTSCGEKNPPLFTHNLLLKKKKYEFASQKYSCPPYNHK